MSSSAAAVPLTTLQDVVYDVLGTPEDWRLSRPLNPFVSKLAGHKPQALGLPRPDAVERCAGCNVAHSGECSGLCYCEPCGEAWCLGCLRNAALERGSCTGCKTLQFLSGDVSPCGPACSEAAIKASERPPCVSNILLSWGSLVVTTGDKSTVSTTGVVPDAFWGCGNLLPTRLVCHRRFWGSESREPAKRVTIRMTVTTVEGVDSPQVIVSAGDKHGMFGPDSPG